MEEILSCIVTYSYYSTYFDYRKIMMDFQKNALIECLKVGYNQFKKIIDIKDISENIINLLYGCLYYSFKIGYYDIEIEPDPTDLDMICVIF